MTFDELFKEHGLTAAEKADLIAYLVHVRAQATRRALEPRYIEIGKFVECGGGRGERVSADYETDPDAVTLYRKA